MTDAPAAVAVEPVADRMRRDAHAHAAELRAAAHAQAAAIVEQARSDAAEAIRAAAATAAAEAAPLVAAELRQARQSARTAVLSAQREARDELSRRVRAAVARFPAEPGYERLVRRLTGLAREAAGPHAQITQVPAGGIEARSGGVIVDCSLSRLADLAVAELGSAITDLWTS